MGVAESYRRRQIRDGIEVVEVFCSNVSQICNRLSLRKVYLWAPSMKKERGHGGAIPKFTIALVAPRTAPPDRLVTQNPVWLSRSAHGPTPFGICLYHPVAILRPNCPQKEIF